MRDNTQGIIHILHAERLGVKALKTSGSVLKLHFGGCESMASLKSYIRLNESKRMGFHCWESCLLRKPVFVKVHSNSLLSHWASGFFPKFLSHWPKISRGSTSQNMGKVTWRKHLHIQLIASFGAWVPFGPLLNCCASGFRYLCHDRQKTEHWRLSRQPGLLYLFISYSLSVKKTVCV